MPNLSPDDKTKIAVLENRVENLENQIDEIKQELKKKKEDIDEKVDDLKKDKEQCIKDIDNKYLTKENFNSRFSPVQLITFGIVGIIVSSILTAIIMFLIKTGPAMQVFTNTMGGH
jgi:acetyl-CoA carboxylase alpha subunit